MGRPRMLSDQERKERNAERQARWREKNRGYERVRARNNYARRKEGSVEEVPKPVVEKREPRVVQETYNISMDEAEGDKEVMRAHADAQRMRGRVGPRQMEPEPKEVTDEGHDEVEISTAFIRRAAFEALKKAYGKPTGVEVDL